MLIIINAFRAQRQSDRSVFAILQGRRTLSPCSSCRRMLSPRLSVSDRIQENLEKISVEHDDNCYDDGKKMKLKSENDDENERTWNFLFYIYKVIVKTCLRRHVINGESLLTSLFRIAIMEINAVNLHRVYHANLFRLASGQSRIFTLSQCSSRATPRCSSPRRVHAQGPTSSDTSRLLSQPTWFSLPHWAWVGHPTSYYLPKYQDQVSSRARSKLSKVDSKMDLDWYLIIFIVNIAGHSRCSSLM